MTAASGDFAFAARVSAVLFDAGNTLLWIDHARIAHILGGAGVPCDEAAVRAAEMRARPRLDPFLAGAARRESADTVARYAALILDGVGAASSRPAHDALVAAWSSLWVRPPADARASLDTLAARGFRLGVVSNSNGRVRTLLEEADLAAPLACVVDSGLVGVEKPDPRIFAIAAERLGLPPAACAYVGDFHSLDVLGARAAGMHGVLIDPLGVWDGVAAPRVASLTELVARLPARAPRGADASPRPPSAATG
jgi:putative hydrolase of the HAD superfamily